MLGRAEQGWTSGGAPQDGQGRVGRAWARRHCIEDESPNNESRIVGQTWPIPTLHSASLVTTCPQPSPTAGPVVPTPWIVCRFRICCFCQALAGQPGPQFGHGFSDYLGSAAVRPCSKWHRVVGQTNDSTVSTGALLDDALQALGARSPRKVLGTIPAPHAAVGHQVPVTLLL